MDINTLIYSISIKGGWLMPIFKFILMTYGVHLSRLLAIQCVCVM